MKEFIFIVVGLVFVGLPWLCVYLAGEALKGEAALNDGEQNAEPN